MSKNITAVTHDFLPDEESGETVVKDQLYYTMGGMVAAKTVKLTKNNQNMAFITLEDLVGTVEVVVFPKVYEQYRDILEPDSKIFVYGRASVSEDEGKLLLEKAMPFSEAPKEVFLRFRNRQDFMAGQDRLQRIVKANAGASEVTVYLKEEKMMKKLGRQSRVEISGKLLQELEELLGEENVVVMDGKISLKPAKRYA